MKAVTGSIVSSKTISLSEAAKILNAFVSVETGGSNAISVFLKRASESFNELAQFHRELKAKRCKRKPKTVALDALDDGNLVDADLGRSVDLEEQESLRHSEVSEERGVLYEEEGSGKTKERKKKKKEKKEKKDTSDYTVEVEEEESIGRKKRERVKEEDEELGASDKQYGSDKKKRKKRRHEEGD